MRTLAEDARGFGQEHSKHRNLLNTAGSDVRNGTLGHRTRVRVLRENDAARNARRRSNPNARTVPTVEPTRPATRATTRTIRHDVATLVVRAIALGLDPRNVASLARACADGSSHNVTVSLGAGRGW